jgi:hypothetical protein
MTAFWRYWLNDLYREFGSHVRCSGGTSQNERTWPRFKFDLVGWFTKELKYKSLCLASGIGEREQCAHS